MQERYITINWKSKLTTHLHSHIKKTKNIRDNFGNKSYIKLFLYVTKMKTKLNIKRNILRKKTKQKISRN